MAPDAERLELQLEKLDERVAELRRLAETPEREFIADRSIQAAAERLLQTSIQSCLDIGNHLIAELQLRRPGTYGEVFTILGESGVLPAEFAGKLVPMARFRNRLVHLYDEVSPDEIYVILRDDLGDFADFAAHIQRYLDSAAG